MCVTREHVLGATGVVVPAMQEEFVMEPRVRGTVFVLVPAFLLLCLRTAVADWPTYKGDPARSSVTAEELGFPLVNTWVYRPSQRPRPAWTAAPSLTG